MKRTNGVVVDAKSERWVKGPTDAEGVVGRVPVCCFVFEDGQHSWNRCDQRQKGAYSRTSL